MPETPVLTHVSQMRTLRKVVKKSDGSKTVIQGGRIVGNLPSDKAVNPISGNGAQWRETQPGGPEPSSTSDDPLHSVYEIFQRNQEPQHPSGKPNPVVVAATTTDLSALRELSRDSDWEVREAVLDNPGAPAGVVRFISRDPDWVLRKKAAQHPNIALADLVNLTYDEHPQVAEAAKHSLLDNPDAPAEVAEELSLDPDWKVRMKVAAHPNTPPSTLKRLSYDKDERGLLPQVVQAALHNPRYIATYGRSERMAPPGVSWSLWDPDLRSYDD